MKKRLKVVVCGVRFGQFYLEAISRSEEFELAGILVRGSNKAKCCSEKYRTKLYTDIEELPEDIDIACVVVKTNVLGGKGTDLAIRLMKKGINVLLEQPIHYKEIVECYKEARNNNVCFYIGNLYMNLPSAKRFMDLAQIIIEKQKPLYLNVDMATQVSFPLMKILVDIIQNARSWDINDVINKDIPFQVLTMKIGDIPVSIRAHNQVDTQVSDNYMHLMYSINLGVPGGCLSLIDTHGPVMWRNRMTIPNYQFIPNDLIRKAPSVMKDNNCRIIGKSEFPSYKEILTEVWPNAILEDIKKIKLCIDNNNQKKLMAEEGSKYLLSSRLWHDVSKALGYPYTCEKSERNPLDIEHVINKYYKSLSLKEKYKTISRKEVEKCVDSLDRACLISMVNEFQKNGIFVRENEEISFFEINKKLNHISEFDFVIKRWVDMLTKRDILAKANDKYYIKKAINGKKDTEEAWEKARQVWGEKLSPEIVFNYFFNNAVNLTGLLNGSIKATYLLFPEGNRNLAGALYRETLIAWYMNESIYRYVNKVIDMKDNIRILEVGAGTGATSDVVISNISKKNNENKIKEYLYTDLSNFFLKNAEHRYEDKKWVRTKILDLNLNIEEQGLESGIQDIIIAAGVINNVKNIDTVLLQLKGLLKEDGILLISEATREVVQMLISQVFMMNVATDERGQTNNTFMSEEQWIRAFSNAGLDIILKAPDKHNKLEKLGQKLFVLQKSR